MADLTREFIETRKAWWLAKLNSGASILSEEREFWTSEVALCDAALRGIDQRSSAAASDGHPTPTPETDKEAFECPAYGHGPIVNAAFARSIERRLRAAEQDRHVLAEVCGILKRGCDRDWKDETPLQIASIASNAIYWRGKRAEKAEAKLAERDTLQHDLDSFTHELTGDEGEDDSFTVLRRHIADLKAERDKALAELAGQSDGSRTHLPRHDHSEAGMIPRQLNWVCHDCGSTNRGWYARCYFCARPK